MESIINTQDQEKKEYHGLKTTLRNYYIQITIKKKSNYVHNIKYLWATIIKDTQTANH
jgi:hypothetical protein